ncbi:3'-5' exonuclease [Latilactobacillus sakei]|uniref:3'-5' exonuclease n=1 Tax=Latilactobacillus sakei TaxID=1599 RepID=UPI000DC64792|nr:3'-5' exonuclease [Latilactobacillus sakei]SPS03481.1 DNA polymerase III PolC-type [Latilactobacillus sakei]
MNFVAMDFETANGQRDSACSIALVVVRNDQIVDQFYTPIKPETYFSSRNSQIHGIYEEDVAQAPKFDQVWPHIAPFFTPQKLVVAHNATFDIGVLRSTLQHYDIPEPHYLALDTLTTSRRLYPQFENHKLNTLCTNLEIPLENHHNALADSIACAKILIKEAQEFGTDPLKQVTKIIG